MPSLVGSEMCIRDRPYNISATAGAIDFKFGAQLGFTKAHHKIARKKSEHGLGLWKRPKVWVFLVNIYTMAEASDFKFGTQLGFAIRPVSYTHLTLPTNREV